MNSMTGFGRAVVTAKLGRMIVEISGVNSRFLEVGVRLSRSLSALEPLVRERITAKLSRGKVSLFASLEQPDDVQQKYHINEAAATQYVSQLKKLQKKLGIKGDFQIQDLLILPEIARPDREELDLKAAGQLLKKAIDQALVELEAMRAREGKALAADMRKRLSAMGTSLKLIEKRSVHAVGVYRDKLSDRIESLLTGPRANSVRLEEEIAIFAERTDIAEECTRLRSHIQQFRSTLSDHSAIGRRLNFIIQEMNREANTIGSKSADFDISTEVISLKEELEKLREQVQNVE